MEGFYSLVAVHAVMLVASTGADFVQTDLNGQWTVANVGRGRCSSLLSTWFPFSLLKENKHNNSSLDTIYQK